MCLGAKLIYFSYLKKLLYYYFFLSGTVSKSAPPPLLTPLWHGTSIAFLNIITRIKGKVKNASARNSLPLPGTLCTQTVYTARKNHGVFD